MKKQIKKYLNIYVVVGFIGFFCFLYLFSFAFVLHDVANGSSAKMYHKMLEEQKQKELNKDKDCMFICLK